MRVKNMGNWPEFSAKSTEILDTPDKIASALQSYQTVTGQSINTATALQVTTVFACIRVLAESVGMLPCKLYKTTGRTTAAAWSHPLYRLLNVAPNNYMTAQEFWELLITCLCLRGNFYAYKNTIGGEVRELLPMDPARVTPKLGTNWEPVYRVRFPSGDVRDLGQDEIWHVRLLTLDGLTGLSPISYARQAIGLALSTEEHGMRLFTNSAVTSGILTTDQALTDTAFKRLKDDLSSNHEGLTNAHKPLVLEMGLDWKPTALNMEDSQFLATRGYQRDEICSIFRVPPNLAGNVDKMTLNNIETFGTQFINYALMPYLTRIEARANVGLLSEKDQGKHYVKFNAGALLRGDLKSRYESYATAINWGILSPNECREHEDLNPRDNGDLYLTPMNMTTKPEAAANANAQKTA